MKYEYSFKELEYADGGKFLKIQLPQELDLVTVFLCTEYVVPFLEEIGLVLFGEKEYSAVAENATELHIKKDITKLINYFYIADFDHANDGEEASCEIETQELKELILIWLEENKKFKKHL